MPGGGLITWTIVELKAVPIGTVLNLRTSTSQKCTTVLRQTCVEDSQALYYSTSGLRVTKKKRKGADRKAGG